MALVARKIPPIQAALNDRQFIQRGGCELKDIVQKQGRNLKRRTP